MVQHHDLLGAGEQQRLGVGFLARAVGDRHRDLPAHRSKGVGPVVQKTLLA